MKIANESPRISGLKTAVENCRQAGLSETEILEICKLEVLGAARLREAIRECVASDRVIRMSFYEQIIDKRIPNEEILAVVTAVVQE
jgi:hypothetical protein